MNAESTCQKIICPFVKSSLSAAKEYVTVTGFTIDDQYIIKCSLLNKKKSMKQTDFLRCFFTK